MLNLCKRKEKCVICQGIHDKKNGGKKILDLEHVWPKKFSKRLQEW